MTVNFFYISGYACVSPLDSILVCKVSKRSIAISDSPHCYGNSHAIWDHTVLPATRQR